MASTFFHDLQTGPSCSLLRGGKSVRPLALEVIFLVVTSSWTLGLHGISCRSTEIPSTRSRTHHEVISSLPAIRSVIALDTDTVLRLALINLEQLRALNTVAIIIFVLQQAKSTTSRTELSGPKGSNRWILDTRSIFHIVTIAQRCVGILTLVIYMVN